MTGKPVDKPYIQKLGNDGIAWVRESLGHTAKFENDKTFSHDVLSKTNLDKGEVYITIAAAEHQNALKNNQPLKNGQFPPGSHNMQMQATLLLDKLKQIEKEHGPISIINEDFMPNPNGPIEKFPASYVYHLYKQYLYIKNLSDIDTASELVDILDLNWLLSAYIVSTNNVPSNNTLSDTDAHKLASSVLGIINYAYDGETYTLWIKEDSEK